MKALMEYQLKHYIRSHRYFPPLLLYVVSILFIYGIVPNPVMESYSLTSAVLFLFSAWLGFSYIDSEHEIQQMISSNHARNVVKYYLAKLIVGWLLPCFLALLTTIYPVLFDKFDRQPDAAEFMVAISAHLAVSALGFVLSALFTSKWVPKLYMSAGGLLLTMALSLAGQGIERTLPHAWRALAWLLPPAYKTIAMLSGYDEASGAEVALGLLLPLIYALLAAVIFLQMMNRRLF